MTQARLLRWSALIGILLLAAALRIYHINLQSLWIDEGFTWNLTQYHDPLRILRLDVHPPLYFMLMDLWVQITGTSVVAMRMFSVLPGLLSVAVIFQLAREIERQRGTDSQSVIPLLAALLLALADPEITLAQEVRSYTWHVLFASLSMWGFLRWMRTPRRADLLLWAGSTIALIYTFYLGAFIGVAQGIYSLLFLRRGRLLMALVVLCLCAVSLLPWVALTAGEQAQNVSRGEVILPADYPFWLNDFRQGFFSGQWGLMVGLFVLGIVLLKQREQVQIRLTPVMVLLLLWFGVPLLLTLIGNSFTPLYQPRRVTQIVPAIALLIAFGLGALPGRTRLFLIVVIMVYSLSSVDFWKGKPLWREFVAEIRPLIANDTPVLVEIGGDDYAPRYHLAEAIPQGHDLLLDREPPLAGSVPILGLTTWRHLQPDQYTGGLPAYIESLSHLWLFYWSSDQGAFDWLNTFGFQRTAAVQAAFNPDVWFYRYDRVPAQPLVTFVNGMQLQDVLLHDGGYMELFWTLQEESAVDFTTSAFLLDASGALVAQFDSQPFLNQRPTSTWSSGETVYDPKRVRTADGSPLPAGRYTAGVLIYRFVDGSIERILSAEGADWFSPGEIEISD